MKNAHELRRISIHVTNEQFAALKRKAKETQLKRSPAVAVVIRDAIDQYLDTQSHPIGKE